jgi:hypothetical protein
VTRAPSETEVAEWHRQNMDGCRIPQLAAQAGTTPEAMEKALYKYRRKHGLAAPGHRPKRPVKIVREPRAGGGEVTVTICPPGYAEGYGWENTDT